MSTTTVPTTVRPAASVPGASPGPAGPRLREVLPGLVSVTMLFGLLMAGAFALRDLADLGLWLAGGG